MKGSVEYENVILTIDDITLRDGMFIASCSGKGPAPEYHGPVRIYGTDGILVVIGGLLECPAARKEDRISVEMTMNPGDIIAD